MFVQLPIIVLAIVLLLLGIASELAAALLGVELPTLTEVLGMSEDALEATFYIASIVSAVFGMMLLRVMPRELAPMGDAGPQSLRGDSTHPHERVAHINDPLQSVYVAIILIAGVLAFSSLS